jgi:SAM-dependent methyltransferase
MKKILSLGCGRRKAESGVVRVDISEEMKPDVVWNLDHTPWPFPDSEFDVVECFDVIEHVESVVNCLQEVHRVLRPGGRITLTTPHFSCANSFIDPTHRHHLAYASFDYFCDGHLLNYYAKARFKITDRRIEFDGGRWNRSIMRRLANRWPAFYEHRLAWIFPAWFLAVELEVVKSKAV